LTLQHRPNDMFRAARLRLPSPTGSGPMSREELADEANRHLRTNHVDGPVTADLISRIEQGRTAWPRAPRRAALRKALKVTTDGEIGLFNQRRRASDQPRPAELHPDGENHALDTTMLGVATNTNNGRLNQQKRPSDEQAHQSESNEPDRVAHDRLLPARSTDDGEPLESGDHGVNRRTILSGFALINGAAMLQTADNARSLADAVRANFAAAFGGHTVDEWLSICEDHGRHCMTDPPSRMQSLLLADLMLIQHQMPTSDSEELRGAAAKLATLYAMTLASVGDAPGAVSWYRTAKSAADRSGDRHLMGWVRGREVLRSDYDGYATPARILTFVQGATGLADEPSIARMEIMVAAARAYARIGEPKRATAAYGQARRAYDAIPHLTTNIESMYYLPPWRFQLRGAFVHAMAGDVPAVERIIEEISAARPANLLRWGVQIDLNRALAAAQAGDCDTAITIAVPTVERTPKAQHTETMRQLVGELCTTVGAGRHRDAAHHLRGLVAAA
jgi:transcriptional regulator with XRE-family HTH domain